MTEKYTYYQEFKSRIHMLYAEEIAESVTRKYCLSLSFSKAVKETRKQLRKIEDKYDYPKLFYRTKSGLKRVYLPEIVSELAEYLKAQQTK